jgi:hypothetical protein
MNKKTKIILALSLALNVSVLVIFFAAVFFKKSAAVFYWNPGPAYTTAALLVSMPLEGENSLSFGPADITLKEGEKAFLRYVFAKDSKQAAWNITYVYDAEVVSLEYTADGVMINALQAGSSTLQTLDRGGVRDACYVTVVER